MPTKHIADNVWRKIEKETVKAVIELKESIKESEMLHWVILRGLKNIELEDYRLIKKEIKNNE